MYVNNKLVDFLQAARTRHKVSPGCQLYPEEELQMAADSSVQGAGAVLQYEALDTADTADTADYYDWDQIFADYSRGAF